MLNAEFLAGFQRVHQVREHVVTRGIDLDFLSNAPTKSGPPFGKASVFKTDWIRFAATWVRPVRRAKNGTPNSVPGQGKALLVQLVFHSRSRLVGSSLRSSDVHEECNHILLHHQKGSPPENILYSSFLTLFSSNSHRFAGYPYKVIFHYGLSRLPPGFSQASCVSFKLHPLQVSLLVHDMLTHEAGSPAQSSSPTPSFSQTQHPGHPTSLPPSSQSWETAFAC